MADDAWFQGSLMERRRLHRACFLPIAFLAAVLATSEVAACSTAGESRGACCGPVSRCEPQSTTSARLPFGHAQTHHFDHARLPHPDLCCSQLPSSPCACTSNPPLPAEHRQSSRRAPTAGETTPVMLPAVAFDLHVRPSLLGLSPHGTNRGSTLRSPLYLRTSHLLF